MNRFPLWLASIAAGLFFVTPLSAGQFKRITIDGNFEDWLGVPVSGSAEAGDGDFSIRDVSIANDDDYLYVRLRMHNEIAYQDYHHQVIIDADADAGTGHPWFGVGSELFIEDGLSYQQKNGQFNEGGGSALGWQASPSGASTQFEMRLSRAALDAEGLEVFNGEDITVSVLAQTLEWQLAGSMDALSYSFATQPEIFEGSKTLTDFQDTFWFYQEFNDPEPGWLFPDFFGNDTWQGGNGFFSVGFEDGVYPVETSVPLASGRTTYYFRTPFLWENAAEGVALLADAHISDGAVIYLNGEEVRRIRMPEGEVDGSTQATSSQATPGEIETFSLPAGALITGENLLMVEMHQSADSLDSLAFGLSLRASDSVPPSFEEPDKPLDREVIEGESTIFELGNLAGTEPYDFQWYKNGAAIEEAVGSRLEIPVVLVGDAGTYAVEVSNASGSVRSRDIVLTTTALPVSFSDESQPADQALVEGGVLALGIDVQGSPDFTYQWYKDDVALEFATGATLIFDPASVEDSGDYHVTVTNRLNSLTSRTAAIEVQSDALAPAIDTLKGGSTTLAITFSEIVDTATAGEISHYSIPGVPVLGVTVGEDLRKVTLETGPMAFGQEYVASVNGVEDRFGNQTTLEKAFRATIVIDGDFGDWEGIDPVATEPMDAEGFEFNQFWVANDEDFLYLRFSFHENIGQLPVDYFYQIFIDGDNDPTTGLSMSTLGSSLMIENGSGWLQVGGGFNEGSVSNIDFLLAPESASQEFECRISLASQKEDIQIFEAEAVGITFNLISTSWEPIESGPTESILYTLTDLPPLVDPEPPTGSAPVIMIRRADGQVEITWDKGSLESSETMRSGSWAPVSEATSPYVIQPDGAARYYRSTE